MKFVSDLHEQWAEEAGVDHEGNELELIDQENIQIHDRNLSDDFKGKTIKEIVFGTIVFIIFEDDTVLSIASADMLCVMGNLDQMLFMYGPNL